MCPDVASVRWFKTDFFRWTNKPPCSRCGARGTKIERRGTAPPTAEESAGEASRVELYGCAGCGADVRFPRYNSPGKLLETRHARDNVAPTHSHCRKLMNIDVLGQGDNNMQVSKVWLRWRMRLPSQHARLLSTCRWTAPRAFASRWTDRCRGVVLRPNGAEVGCTS